MGVSLLRTMVARALGITVHRPFPKFSSRRARLTTTERGRPGEKVILLSDAFARYIEPETGQAALDILSACGFDVQVLPILGAGASFLSKGFIDRARSHAARLLDFLNQADPERKAPIVGIEPPEIYTFKHEYIDLLPERAGEILQRTANVWVLEEYLLRTDEFHSLRIAKKGRFVNASENTASRKVFFHPHCHQRAEGLAPDGLPAGTSATLELLRSCDYDVQLMDTGCCGMAGTFGYEAEHYDLSMKIGELQLFPQIRKFSSSNLSSQFASSGAACRMQIQQGTGVGAVHPILLVAQQVREWKRHDPG
jgi:Fe-S oxidoreductase